MTYGEIDPEDPLSLHAVRMPEVDPVFEAQCLIDEFLANGMSPVELKQVFRNPVYQATYALFLRLGEEKIFSLLDQAVKRGSGLSCTVQHRGGPEAPEQETIDFV